MASFLFKYVKIRNGVEEITVKMIHSVYAETQEESINKFYETYPEGTVRIIDVKKR